jgi:hypothetical protein
MSLTSLLKKHGFEPLAGSPRTLIHNSGEFFSAIVVRSSGARDGSSLVELKLGVEDDLMPGASRWRFAPHHYLNPDDISYFTWGRQHSWPKGNVDELTAAMSGHGFRHLESMSKPGSFKAYLTVLLEDGHPNDPSPRQPRGWLGRLLQGEIVVAKPGTAGVPSCAYLLGVLCHRQGQFEEAARHLRRYQELMQGAVATPEMAAIEKRIELIEGGFPAGISAGSGPD